MLDIHYPVRIHLRRSAVPWFQHVRHCVYLMTPTESVYSTVCRFVTEFSSLSGPTVQVVCCYSMSTAKPTGLFVVSIIMCC
jgi:hypothetical protein